MAMSKEQRRKLHGIGEPLEPGDPRVMARRHLHEAVTKWDLRWATTINFLSGAIAFAVVLLPTLLPPWRSVIESVRPLAVIHYELTRPSVWLLLPLAIALCLGVYSTSKRDYKKKFHIMAIQSTSGGLDLKRSLIWIYIQEQQSKKKFFLPILCLEYLCLAGGLGFLVAFRSF
jgi:hypothetical protein